MKAVGFSQPQPIESKTSLLDLELPQPVAGPGQILVRVKAVSVNPIDTKMRIRTTPAQGSYQVLGWDAAGVVIETGEDTTRFKKGDEVFYAGALNNRGTNAEYHVVDERIVGRKPTTLTFEEAAAMPLTSITAWESLFTRLQIDSPVPGGDAAVVIIGAAGGVGSIAMQLVRAQTNLTVIATASRPETVEWCKESGAHHVIDHSSPLKPQLEKVGIPNPSFVFSVTQTHRHLKDIASFIAPQGRMALIDDPVDLDISPLKQKSISIHWESMFTRSVFNTPDIAEQGRILNTVSQLLDAGKIRTTMKENFGVISAKNLKAAHSLLESGRSIGKIVLTGY